MRSDSARTQQRLLDTAERLFAMHGLQAVSLRAINAEAGARNVSAAHYHFGSKEGVVRALVARRMEWVARERMAALDAVEAEAAGGVPSLRALVEAMVLPLLRVLAQGSSHATFLARATGEPGLALEQIAPPVFWTMVQRLLALVGRVLPDLPMHVLALRVRCLFQQTFVTVIEIDRLTRGRGGPVDAHLVESIGADLVDYLVGGIGAPSRAGSAGVRKIAGAPPPRYRHVPQERSHRARRATADGRSRAR